MLSAEDNFRHARDAARQAKQTHATARDKARRAREIHAAVWTEIRLSGRLSGCRELRAALKAAGERARAGYAAAVRVGEDARRRAEAAVAAATRAEETLRERCCDFCRAVIGRGGYSDSAWSWGVGGGGRGGSRCDAIVGGVDC